MDYIFLIIGFFLLIKGADFFVDGSANIAKILKVPPVVIGLTIVACGTSLPELAVSLTAALEGANDLAVANVVGSNVFNSLIVIGACAIITPIKFPSIVMKNDFPFYIFITGFLFTILAGTQWTQLFNPLQKFQLARIEGIALLILFVAFIIRAVKSALNERIVISSNESESSNQTSIFVSIMFIIFGAMAIMYGGQLVVNAASRIGGKFGMSQSLIGMTIVALGTSLPEMVTSIVAAKKGENDLAMGNIIGSNIFNVLLILGTSSAISPIYVSQLAVIDVLLTFIIAVVVYIFAKTRKEISKGEGLVLIMMYGVFFCYIVMR